MMIKDFLRNEEKAYNFIVDNPAEKTF